MLDPDDPLPAHASELDVLTFTNAAHAELSWMLRRALAAERVVVNAAGREVVEPDTVAGCWARVCAWPGRVLLGMHDGVGCGFVGDVDAALRQAAAGQL